MPPTPPPTDPVRDFSFTDHSTNYPTTPQPGDELDQEIDRSNAAIAQLKTFVRQVIADDGTLKPGAVGNDQLDVDLVTDITNDVLAQVDPQVSAAQGYSSSAQTSADAAAQSAADAASISAGVGTLVASAQTAEAAAMASSAQAQIQALASANAATNAANARNTAQLSEGKALNYAVLAQLWAEHLDGATPIPDANLAQMGVTGAHWSARYWAFAAAAAAAAVGAGVPVPIAARSVIGNLSAVSAAPVAVPVQPTALFSAANDGALPTSKAIADYIATQLAAHLAAADPHPTYTTAAELSTALAAYQPLDSDLTAIAALATTSFGRAFLGLSNAAGARTHIDAEQAGVAASLVSAHEAAADPHPTYTTAAELSTALAAYQPLDSDLTAIAALSTTSFGRGLLALADAAAARTALALGALAVKSTIATTDIDNLAVTGAKLADAAVTMDKLAPDARLHMLMRAAGY